MIGGAIAAHLRGSGAAVTVVGRDPTSAVASSSASSNVFDHNALIDLHPDMPDLYFANGFSGRGMQQAPSVGRGIAEPVLHGAYRTLDLSLLSVARLAEGRPLPERNII